MDTCYIGIPHEYDALRVYSQFGTDWEERINFARLRNERLARVRTEMQKAGIPAMLLFDGNNIRYATGYYPGNWKLQIFVRYCLLMVDADPILFETAGADLECARIEAPWLRDNLRPAIVWKWSGNAEPFIAERMAQEIHSLLKDHGLDREKVGLDTIDTEGRKALSALNLDLVDAWPVMIRARLVKTSDELELLKQASAMGDACFHRLKEEWLKPGIRENEVVAKISEFLYDHGCQMVWEPCVASGGHTNPYRRSFTEKIIRHGDLVIVDIIASGPCGYMIDYVRTFKVGGQPTAEEKRHYTACYDSLNRAIDRIKPGATTSEVAAEFPEYDDDKYKTCTLFQFGHSLGLNTYEGFWITRGYSLEYPQVIEQNMYLAIETYSGCPGVSQAVRLEENLVVTDKGVERFTRFPFEEDFLLNKC